MVIIVFYFFSHFPTMELQKQQQQLLQRQQFAFKWPLSGFVGVAVAVAGFGFSPFAFC